MNIYGLILAGGVGSRCGADTPKQYIEIDGKPVFIYTAESMQSCGLLKGICIVCAEEWREYVTENCKKYGINLIGLCDAGGTGLESIWSGFNALLGLGAADDDVVVIHDANRPFIDAADIEKGVGLCRAGCSIAVVKQTCDLASMNGDKKKLVLRDGLYELIRPEFHTVKNLKYCKNLSDGGDFASQNPACLLLENGGDIEIFESKSLPVKITYSADLEVFKAVLHWRNLNK